MEEYADIYYVDARNAVTDHRRPAAGGGVVRPGFPVSTPTRAVVVPPPGARPPVYGGQAPIVYQQPAVPVGYPTVAYPQSPFAGLFARVTTGQLIEMIVQGFAAIQSLPAAPTATDNARDNIENLVLYQTALAQHAKRDEQLRTIGSIVSKLV
jgi:hypothetical protein